MTVSAAPVSPAVASDYRLSDSPVLTIAAGATSSTGAVTITAVNRGITTPRQVTVSATAVNVNGITNPASQTLIIAAAGDGDDDLRFVPSSAVSLFYPLGVPITATTLPQATDGIGALAYTLSHFDLPLSDLGLTYTAATRTLTGTPTLAGAGNDADQFGFEFAYTVTDEAGDTADLEVFITICEVGAVPAGTTECTPPDYVDLAFTATVGAQSYSVNTAIPSLTLPNATGGTGASPRRVYELDPLPAGLAFDSTTRILSGTPTDPGVTGLTYTVTDVASNRSLTQAFDVTVTGPTLGSQRDLTYPASIAITPVTLPEATGGAAPLVYTLTGPNGESLATAVPGLTFAPDDRILSGTPTTAGLTTLTYTVTDSATPPTTDVQTFTVTVTGATLAQPEDIITPPSTLFTSGQLPELMNAAGPITYTVTRPNGLLLPTGLTFTPTTRVLSGQVAVGGVTIPLEYSATFGGGNLRQPFNLRVTGPRLPVVDNQVYLVNVAIEPLTLPLSTGGGIGAVSYALTEMNAGPDDANLPAGLTYTAATRVLSGTPTETGSTILAYTATDSAPTPAVSTRIFGVSVNAIPLGDGPILPLIIPRTYTLNDPIPPTTLPMALEQKADGTTVGPLTYTLTGPTAGPDDDALPAGLTFTAATRALFGTPTALGVTPLTYTVTDLDNFTTTTRIFNVVVIEPVPPVLGGTLPTPGNQRYVLDEALTPPVTLPASPDFVGTPTYTLTGPSDAALPAGLTFTAGTRTISGTPTTLGVTPLTYTVADATSATSATSVTFDVAVVRDGLLTLPTPDDQRYELNQAITPTTLPAATDFTGTTVSYTLTGTDGTRTFALPIGLTFNPDDRVLSGTPRTGFDFDFSFVSTLAYTATDENGSVTVNFDVTIAAVDAPVAIAPPNQSYTVGRSIIPLTLESGPSSPEVRTYTLTGPTAGPGDADLPAGLTFNPATRVLSGTPTTEADAVTLTYTVTDTVITDTATFDVTITPATAAPTITSIALTSDAGDDVYAIDDVIDATAIFSEAVTVDGQPPQLALIVGTQTRQAVYTSDRSTTTALVFSYTVAAGDLDTDGVSIGSNALTRVGSTIRNAADTEDARLTHTTVVGTAAHTVDGIVPTVSGVAITSTTGPYVAGEVIALTATFSEAVTVETAGGTPQIPLELEVSDGTPQAVYVSGSTTTELVFSYTVVAGDNDDDGVAVSVNTLTANGGTIRDAAGNNAVLAHNAIAADVANRVDTVAPTVSAAAINGFALTLAYSEALDASSVPASTDYTLTLESGTAPTVNPDGVAIAGTTVTLTLNAAVVLSDVVTLIYTVGANPVQDEAGNDAAGFIDLTVRNTTPPPTVSLAAPGGTVLMEGGSGVELVVSLDGVAPEGGVLVQLDSLQTVPLTTPDNVTYGLDYRVLLASTAVCDTTDFSFDDANPATLGSRLVEVPFPAGCDSQTLTVRALEDVDGLDETLAFSLVEGAGYTVTSVLNERSRTLTVTDNEPVVTLGPLVDPFVDDQVSGLVTETNYIAVDVLLPATYDLNVSPSVTVNLEVSGDIEAADVVTYGANPTPLTALSSLLIDGSSAISGQPSSRRAFYITVADNEVEEPDDEVATVTLLPGDGYRLPATDVSRSVTILDSLRVTIRDTDDVHTAVEGGDPVPVTLELSRRTRPSLGGERANVFITLQPSGDYTVSATDLGGNEYRVQSSSGQDSITVTVTAAEDDDTIDEEVTLTLTSMRVANDSLPGYSFVPEEPLPTVTIILEDNDAGALLAADTLTEDTLNGSTVTVTLVNTEYVGTPSTADFTLTTTDVPGTVTVSGVSRDSATEATLTLAYVGTNLTADGTLSVTVRESGHTGSGNLATNSVPIMAIIDDLTGAVTEDAVATDTGRLFLPGGFVPQTGVPDRANGQGAYGSFTLADAGAWVYTLDNADDVTNALAAGIQVTDVFTAVSAADTSVTQAVTITVTGANDAPTANAGPDQPAVIVGATVTLDGSGTDPDTGDSIDTYTWTQSAGPAVTLSDATVARPTFPAPSVTSATDLTFALVVNDGEANSEAPDTVTITVSPGITGDTTGMVTEGGVEVTTIDTATGQLDNPIGDFAAQAGATDRANGQGVYGSFTLADTGAWTYTLDNADVDTDALPVGATVTDVFTAVSSENPGVTRAVTITVTGANDAPTVDAGADQTVPREATVHLIGSGTDPDTGDQALLTYVWTQTDGTPTVTLDPGVASNRVTFVAPTLTADTTLTFTLTVTDRQTVARTDTVTVTIDMDSTASIITGNIFGGVTEDAVPNTATGILTVTTGGIVGTFHTQTDVPGTYGAFTLDENGGWTYTLDNEAAVTDALPLDSDSIQETFPVLANDMADGLADTPATVTIFIDGANDRPTVEVVPPAQTVDEESLVTLTGTGDDVDTGDRDTLRYRWRQTAGLAPGVPLPITTPLVTLTNADTATATFTAPNLLVNTRLTFTLTVADLHSVGVSDTVIITVEADDDASVIGGDQTGSVTEDDITQISATGRLTVMDPEGNNRFQAQVEEVPGRYGTLGSLAATGEWVYGLDNSEAATQALAADTTGEETFNVVAADGTLGLLTILVTGVNDAPTATGRFQIGDLLTGSATGGVEVMLVGTGSDRDTGEQAALSYAWTQVSGEPTVTLSDATTATATFTAPPLTAATTLEFELTVTDGRATDTARVRVLVRATDNIPAFIGGMRTGGVTEDTELTATGTLVVADEDGPDRLEVQEDNAGTYGTFTLVVAATGATGVWSYTLNNDADVVQALAANQQVTERFAVRAADNTRSEVVITVTGANDLPTADAGLAQTVEEGTTVVLSGSDSSDPDRRDQLTYQWTPPASPPAIRLDNAAAVRTSFEAPQLTAQTDLTFTLTVTDPSGASSTGRVIVTVTADDDPAIFGGIHTGSVTESSATENNALATQAFGRLTVTDPDGPNDFVAQADNAGIYGTFTLSADGRWSYVLNNADLDTDALGVTTTVDAVTNAVTIVPDQVTESFTVQQATEGTTEGADDPESVVITITGVNDATVVDAGLAQTVVEGAEVMLTGRATDPDDDQAELDYEWTQTGGTPTVTLTDETTLTATFTAPQLVADTLLTFTLTVTDPTTATATDTVIVTVTATNAPAVFAGNLGGITESADNTDPATTTGTLSVTDPDSANTIQEQTTPVTGTYGSFTLAATGAWTYTLNNAAPVTNALAATDIVTEEFAVQAMDDATLPATTTGAVVITVTGANDAPSATVDAPTQSVNEDALVTLSGSGSDPDDDQAELTYAWTQTAGTPTVTLTDAATATATFTAPQLTANTELTFTLTVTDPTPATDSATVIVTILADNDGAEFAGNLGGITEDAVPNTATGTLTVTDPDSDNTIQEQTTPVAGTYGSFTLADTGAWTYTLDNTATATQALAATDSVTEEFAVVAVDVDDTAVTTTGAVVITVTGANDAPTAMAGDDQTITTEGAEVTLIGTDSSDPDGDVLTYRWLQTGGPAVVLTNENTARATFTAPVVRQDTDLTFELKVTDRLAMATDTVTVTIEASDRPTSITGTLTGDVTEDALETMARGILTATDPDGDLAVLRAQATPGIYGTFTLVTTGAWVYELDNDDSETDALIEGAEVTETFPVEAADAADSTTATAAIVIRVTGANDDPTAMAGDDRIVDEGNRVTLAGTGTDPDTDPDTGEQEALSYAWTQTGGTTETTVPLTNADTVSVSFTAPQLTANETLTFRLTVTDPQRAAHTDMVMVTVRADNDAATISGEFIGNITEDADPNTVTGMLTVDDPDGANDFRAQSTTSIHGSFELAATGAWTYTLNNDTPVTNRLSATDTITDETFPVQAADDTPATVVIIIFGANDPPAALAGTDRNVPEASVVTLNGGGTDPETNIDPDTGAPDLTYAWAQVNITSGVTPMVDLASTNTARTSFTAPDQVLEPTALTFELTVTDGEGKTGTDTVVITVLPVNDPAVITGVRTGTVTEDAAPVRTTAVGTLSANDPDDPLNNPDDTFQVQSNVPGTYGTFSVTSQGEWTYILDNALDATNALNRLAGTERFPVQTADGTPDVVVITVIGADDPAEITGTTTGAVTAVPAATQPVIATGTLTVTDPDRVIDPDSPVVTVTFQAPTSAGTYGTFSVTAQGVWTYSLNNEGRDTIALAAGVTETDEFTVTADGATTIVTITVTGADDPVVITGTTTGAVTEDREPATATGTLVATDPDSPGVTVLFQVQLDAPGTYGTFSVTNAGVWTYTLNNEDAATNALAAGATGSDSFTATATADVATTTVTITITGADDPSTIGGDLTGTVTAVPAATQPVTDTGTLTATDPDGIAAPITFTAPTSVGTYGSLSLTEAGVWTYTLNNEDAATIALAAGVTATDAFTVRASDGADDAVIAITVTGANDPANITGITTGTVTEDAEQVRTTATGTLSATDPDSPGAVTFREQLDTPGTYGTFSVTDAGVWAYTLDNGDVDTNALFEGLEVTDTFTVETDDGTGESVEITVIGADDPAELTGTTGSVTEDAAPVSTTAIGTLRVIDPDGIPGAVTFQAPTSAGTYGNFSLAVTGEWIYILDNEVDATNELTADATDAFSVRASDGTEGIVTITVTGANDPSDISGDLTRVVIENLEDINTATGFLTAMDPDGPDNRFRASGGVGTYGIFSLNSVGVWRYFLDNANPDTDELPGGAVRTETFPVQTEDGTMETLTVTILGADDPPTISGEFTGAVTEDGADVRTTATGTLTVTDVDNRVDADTAFEAQTQTDAVVGTYGTFTLTAAGAWSYTLNNADPETNALAGDVTMTDVFTAVSATDNDVTQAVTITVTGANDAPTADAGDRQTVPQGAVVRLSGTRSNDPDTGDQLTYAWTQSDTPTVTLTDEDTVTARFTATFDPDLTADTTLTFTLTVTDRRGSVSDPDDTVTVTIDADNTPAVITGALTGSVIEDADETTTGLLTATDSPALVPQFLAQSDAPGTYGAFTLTEAGVWTYTLNNADPDTNALGVTTTVDAVTNAVTIVPDMVTETFQVQASDNTPEHITITVTGANDVPTANAGPDQANVSVDDTVTLDGSGSRDPEDGNALTYRWVQLGTTAVLNDADTATPTFVVIAADANTVLTFELTVTDPDGATATDTVTIAVQAQEALLVVSIDAGTSPVTEGDDATFTLTVDSAPATDLVVRVEVTDSGNFIAGTAPTIVTINASATTATLTVPTDPDGVDEANGTITATVATGIGGYTAAVEPDDRATVDVRDDDDPPMLAITSPSVPEGDSGTVRLTYTVTLTEATDQTVTVRYAVDASSTATAIDDYTALPAGTLTFTPGMTTQLIEVTVTGDTIDEENETILVLLSDAINATIATALGTGTITDDDGLPIISIAAMPSSVTEGTAATFILTADPAPATELTVMVSVTDSGDFIAGPAPTMVTIAADATTATLTVDTTDDENDELNGVITATVEEDTDTDADYMVAASPANTATVAVEDDDDDAVAPLVDPVITIAAGTSPVDEGTAATFRLTATPAPTADLTVTVSVDDEPGNFIAGSAPTTVTIPASETTATLTVLTENDVVNEANGMITATVGNGVGYTFVAPATASVAINDDDLPGDLPTLEISLNSSPSVDEGDNETAIFIYRVRLREETEQTVTVEYAFTGTATEGVDYSVLPSGGGLVFPPGTTIRTIQVSVIDDTIDEDDETVDITLSNPVNADITTAAAATGTIRDNDTPVISIVAVTPSVIEGTAATFRLTATLAPRVDLAVMVTLTDPGSFIQGAAPTMMRLAAGTTTATLSVPTVNDTTDEPNNVITATVTPGTVTPGGANYAVAEPPANRAVVGVEDNDGDADPVITIAAGTSPVTEGTAATFRLTASPAPMADLTVMVTVTDPGNFIFGARPTMVTIAARETTATLTVPTTDDEVGEADDTITVVVASGADYAVGTPDTASVMIDDNDALPMLAIDSPSVEEGDSGSATLTYTVTLSGATERTVAVEYAVTGGTATVGVDYSPLPSGSLEFMPGVTTQIIEVAVTGDRIDEDDETVIISLQRPINAGITIADGTGTITNDDNPNISIVAVTSPVDEGTAATFTLTADPAPAEELTVMVTVTDSGNFIDESAPTPTMVTIAASATTATLTVPTADDGVDEANGMITATVDNGVGYTPGDPATASVAIDDNDDLRTLAIDSPPSVDEGDIGSATLSYTVTLTGATEQRVTVRYAVTGGTATEGVGADADYVLPPGTLTFAPGTLTQTIEATVTGDTIDETNETIIVTLSDPDNATITTAIGTGTITNDDADPVVTLVLTPATITQSGGPTTVTATLDPASSASSASTTVTVSAAPVSPAIEDDYDLSASSVLTIDAGATSSTGLVTITAVNRGTTTPRLVTVSATAVNANGIELVVSQTLRIEANPPVATAPDNQIYTVGRLITPLTLALSPSSPDATTYTLTGPNAGPGDDDLPAGLTFNPATRILSGTPTVAAVVTLTYTVSDGVRTVTATFDVTIIPETAPVITAIALTSNAVDDVYAPGEVIDATVTFSEAVTVTGTPELALTVGTATRQAVYDDSDSTTTTLVFSYTVVAGDLDVDGVSIGSNALTRAGSTIQSEADSEDAQTTHSAVADDPEHTVDGVVPTVAGVAITSTTGPYALGETIVLTATFSEAVTVVGTPQIPLLVGTETRQAVYDSDSSTTTELAFGYTVVAGDNDDNGVAVAQDTLTAGGTIRDAAGNDAVLAHNAITEALDNRVDTIIPMVDTAAINGAVLTLTYSEALDASSVPVSTAWTLTLGSGTVPTVNPDGVAIDGRTVTLTLNAAVVLSDVVTLNLHRRRQSGAG